jgi:hypothetical protein
MSKLAMYKIVWIDSAEEQMNFMRAGEDMKELFEEFGGTYGFVDIACGGAVLKAKLLGFGEMFVNKEGKEFFLPDKERSLHEQVVLVGVIYGPAPDDPPGFLERVDEVLEFYGFKEGKSEGVN